MAESRNPNSVHCLSIRSANGNLNHSQFVHQVSETSQDLQASSQSSYPHTCCSMKLVHETKTRISSDMKYAQDTVLLRMSSFNI